MEIQGKAIVTITNPKTKTAIVIYEEKITETKQTPKITKKEKIAPTPSKWTPEEKEKFIKEYSESSSKTAVQKKYGIKNLSTASNYYKIFSSQHS